MSVVGSLLMWGASQFPAVEIDVDEDQLEVSGICDCLTGKAYNVIVRKLILGILNIIKEIAQKFDKQNFKT